jgi:hypothetical protein
MAPPMRESVAPNLSGFVAQAREAALDRLEGAARLVDCGDEDLGAGGHRKDRRVRACGPTEVPHDEERDQGVWGNAEARRCERAVP